MNNKSSLCLVWFRSESVRQAEMDLSLAEAVALPQSIIDPHQSGFRVYPQAETEAQFLSRNPCQELIRPGQGHSLKVTIVSEKE